MPPHSWPLDPVPTLQHLGHGREASSLAMFAVWSVDGLYHLVDVDDAVFSTPRNLNGHHPDALDLAHARWAATSAITAVDLCAAALGRLYCGVTGAKQFSLRDLHSSEQAQRFSALSPAAQAWVRAVESDRDYEVVLAARNPLTHASVARDVFLSTVPEHGHQGRIALAVFGRPDDPNDRAEAAAKQAVPARTLIEKSRDFAVTHVEAFLTEVQAGGIA